MDFSQLSGTDPRLRQVLRGSLPRLLAAWISVLTYRAFFHYSETGLIAFTDGISLSRIVGATVLLFLLFSVLSFFVSRVRTDIVLLAAASLLYAFAVSYTAGDVFVGVAVCLVLGAILWYCAVRKGRELRFSPKLTITLSAVAALIFIGFVGGYTAIRYLSFRSPNYDFGIFVNMFHYMKTRFLPLVTSERDRLLSHFAVHISPVYYLILPFYLIFPSPVTLQIAQAVILASGVIPVYLLSRRFGFSHQASFLWCCAYCFYPALSGGCSYDIHENCFLAPFLLWLFYFAEKEKKLPVYLLAFLTFSVKEDAAIYVAFFGLFLLISRKNRKTGLFLTLLSVGVFLAESAILTKYGEGIMNYRYQNYFTGSGSMFNAVVNIVKDPALVLRNLLNEDKLKFLLLMLIPLLGMPFLFGRKPVRLILLGPFLLVNLMPQYVYQYSLYFQYLFGSLAFLFYAAMMNASERKLPSKRAIPLLCAALGLTLTLATVAQNSYLFTDYAKNRETYRMMDELLDEIPSGLSVRSSTFLLPHLADRDVIYSIKSQNETDCVVVDLRYPDYENGRSYDSELQRDPDFFCLAREEGLLAIYVRRGAMPEQTDADSPGSDTE